jgi:cysteine-rich repeat protein
VLLGAALFVGLAPSVAVGTDGTPLFQFLAFYSGDLEILPGPIMHLHGPIHTNGSLYLNSANNLTIAESAAVPIVSVSAAGSIVRGRKDDPASCTGTVSIASLQDANNDGILDRLNMPCYGNQTDAQLAQWLGSIRARQPVLAVPDPSILSRGAGQYWIGADLRIVLNLDRPDPFGRFPIEAQDVNGAVDPVANTSLQAFMNVFPGAIFYNDRPRPGEDQDLPCSNGNSYCRFDNYLPPLPDANHVYPCARTGLGLYPLADCPFMVLNEIHVSTGTLTARKGGFYNNREHAWVYMLNVNVRDLLWWNRSGPMAGQLFNPDDDSDFGVVVFLSVQGPGSTGAIPSPRYGVRVFGSPNLDFPAMADPTGLTVTSDQAVYVEGDYNVGNGATPRVPASLVGDTINVLSNNWWRGYTGDLVNYPNCKGDCQSRRPLANRTAGHAIPGWAGFPNRTDVFAAFIGGVDVTAVGNYNGGFENYPRFHERWGGVTSFYRGSFVSLGQPQRANGPWCGTGAGCNIYDPPVRNWNFDAAFLNTLNLPPLTPHSGCGDGVVDPGEACDDGNTLPGDCCTPTCSFEPAGAPCTDASPCSTDACDGAGVCAHTPGNAGVICRPADGACDAPESCDGVTPECPADLAAVDGTPCDDADACTLDDTCRLGACEPGTPDPCDDGNPCTRDACDTAAGCAHDATPDATCRAAASSSFQLTRSDGATRSLRWRWSRGTSTSVADFGDPTTSTGYVLCLFDAAGVVLSAEVPPGTPRWRARARGYRYRDAVGAAADIEQIGLVASGIDRTRITLVGKGDALPDPDLDQGLTLPITLQLRRDDADQCWGQTFQPEDTSRNDEGGFKARAVR